MKDRYLGIGLSLIIALLAFYLKGHISLLGASSIALIIGILINGKGIKVGAKFIEKKVLPIAIMLLGITLNAEAVTSLGLKSVLLVLLMVAVTIISAALLGKIFKMDKKLALLIGTGNAVCGSSAILSSSEVIDADDVTVGTSVAIINFLGVLGIFLLPALCRIVGLDLTNSSILLGGALQSVGNVTASSSFIEGSFEIAIMTKMLRVSSLVLVLISYSLLFKKKDSKLSIPPFIIGFILLFVIANIGIVPVTLINIVDELAGILIVICMAAIGLSINIREVLKVGKKGLIIGALNWGIQIGCYLVGLWLLF